MNVALEILQHFKLYRVALKEYNTYDSQQDDTYIVNFDEGVLI